MPDDEGGGLPEDEAALPKLDRDILLAAQTGDAKEMIKILAAGDKKRDEIARKDEYNKSRGIIVHGKREKDILGVHCADISGDKPLTLAASYGRLEAVQLLLERNADPDSKDKMHVSALMRAAAAGHDATVDALLAGGANLHAVARDGSTALDHAARFGQVDTAKRLVAKGASHGLAVERKPGAPALLPGAAAAQKAAPAYILSFDLPYMRADIFHELAKFNDPLDYPAAQWRMEQRAGPAALVTTAGSVSPGLTRQIEAKAVLGGALAGPTSLELELLELRTAERLRWRMLRAPPPAVGAPRIEGEEYASELLPPGVAMRGGRAVPETLVCLEPIPYGTRVQIHVGTHGRFALDGELEWARGCVSALASAWLACTQGAAMGQAWASRMQSRGYATVVAKAPPRARNGVGGANGHGVASSNGGASHGGRSGPNNNPSAAAGGGGAGGWAAPSGAFRECAAWRGSSAASPPPSERPSEKKPLANTSQYDRGFWEPLEEGRSPSRAASKPYARATEEFDTPGEPRFKVKLKDANLRVIE